MQNLSEYALKPRHILVHNPKTDDELLPVSSDNLATYNFLAAPDPEQLYAQYGMFLDALHGLGMHAIELRDLLSKAQREYFDSIPNPNSMFTRDPVITLPWAQSVFIKSRMRLASRHIEPAIMARALVNFGMEQILTFDGDEYLEGGDVLPVVMQGKRVLIVGIGGRTSEAAVRRLATVLFPEYADVVIGVQHHTDVLHLDTGLSFVDERTILAADDTFLQGFMIDAAGNTRDIEADSYAKQLGFEILRIPRRQAIDSETCNLLPLGDGVFLSFRLSDEIKTALTTQRGIKLHEIDGSELAKTAGGIHCLTRPLY